MTRSTSDPRTSVSTRLATAADSERVGALVSRYREEFGHAGAGAAFPPLGHGPLSVILAEVDGQTVGMVAAHRCYAFATGEEYLLLSDIYVRPKHRRKNAANALMDGAKRLGQQLGVHAMRLFV